MERLAVGVDVGGTNIRVALGDERGRIIARISERTEKHRGPEGISRQIARNIRSLIERIGGKKIEGIGIGSAGPLDLKRGGLMKPTNIPYDFVPLVEPLREEFDLPVYLLNDCSVAVVGERFFGAGKEHENLAYITLSTGIGGGIYVDGHLLIGKDGNATEIGHFTIDCEGRLLCGCGKRGHWEAYCSGNGIPNYVKLLLSEEDPEEVKDSLLMRKINGNLNLLTAKILYDCAKAGDPLSLKLTDRIGVLNAIGFACVIDAYDPSLITVGGSIALRNESLVLSPIRKYVGEHARNRVPEIRITPLGDDVVLYGAIAMVFHPIE
ncbi:ROK family protein [Candidatus Bathyarchaeota archaeon]|nr:MAG: ROK family protein [Candidatus Bathyarchaeota archaeon]